MNQRPAQNRIVRSEAKVWQMPDQDDLWTWDLRVFTAWRGPAYLHHRGVASGEAEAWAAIAADFPSLATEALTIPADAS